MTGFWDRFVYSRNVSRPGIFPFSEAYGLLAGPGGGGGVSERKGYLGLRTAVLSREMLG